MKIWNAMAPSYPSEVTSTQNRWVPFFSCLDQGVNYHISMNDHISMFGLRQSFSDNSNLIILVDVQRFHENGKWILCISNGTKWLSVLLRTKWLWNRFLLQLLKLQISPLFVLSKELLDVQATTECTFTPKRVCDMIRIHS